MLLERNSQLGGTTTTGGVCFPGLFHAWGKQVIGGIGWELVAKSVEVDGRKLQDFHQGSSFPRSLSCRYQWRSSIRCWRRRPVWMQGSHWPTTSFPRKWTQSADGWLVDVVGQGVAYQLALCPDH